VKYIIHWKLLQHAVSEVEADSRKEAREKAEEMDLEEQGHTQDYFNYDWQEEQWQITDIKKKEV
jgi:hypothetical protein